MIRRPPRSTQSRSSAASDVYKRQVLLEPLAERDIAQQADEAAVHPAQLLGVEDARAGAQLEHVELLDEVVQRPGDHALVELGAEKTEIVAHDLHEIAHGRQLLELGRAVPFAELLLVGAEEQRHVQEPVSYTHLTL